MNLRIFIDRPVLSIVISIVIVLMGVISLTGLPVDNIRIWLRLPYRYMPIIREPMRKLFKNQ